MQLNLEALQKSACSNPDILNVWSECTMGIDNLEKSTKLLQEVVNTWITIRGHSIANMAMEQHKKEKNDTNKKRGL